MKRKRMDRDIWTDITVKRYCQKRIIDDKSNLCSIMFIDKVSRVSTWYLGDHEIVICDRGLRWFQYIPEGENYMVTSIINDSEEIILWYIDVIYGYGFCEDGVIYYDDLYLDVIVKPNGEIMIEDMDELIDAKDNQAITETQYDLAITTLGKLQNNILCKFENFKMDCYSLYKSFIDK